MSKLRILVACAVLASFAFLQVSDGTAEASGACGKIKGDYALRLTSVKSFSAESPATSGLATAPYQDILRVGILKIADSCQVTADVRATIDNNAGATRLVVFKWTGTAFPSSVSGLGELRVQPPALPAPQCFDSTTFTFATGKPSITCPANVEGAEEYEYAAFRQRDQRGLELIQSDNNGGGAKIFLTGTAERLQRDDDDDD